MGKAKKINFELIPAPAEGECSEPYELLEEARRKWHPDLAEAKIALAWRKELRPNADGRLILGKCMKASDLQRELVDWDVVILLNREAWSAVLFTREKKLALVDHELCHATRAKDKNGFAKTDERGRPVWRMRGHDVEEFRCIVERHGVWKGDLEAFAESLLKQKQGLFAEAAAAPLPERQAELVGTPGFIASQAARPLRQASMEAAPAPGGRKRK